MKPFFVMLFLAILIASCSHPPKQTVAEAERSMRQEMDAKFDSIEVKLQESIHVMQNNIELQNAKLAELDSVLAGYRKNITEFEIPRDATLCDVVLPLDHPDARERFDAELFWLHEHQDQLMLYFLRANLWFPDIERLLAEHGMPDDLKYVPVGESALKARARSGAKAQGWWQFIAGTGSKYGLKSTSEIDMRNDLIESTKGAIKYLQDLIKKFDGDWALALAAYNMGENGLGRDVRDQGTDDYFSLELPQETMQYVFRLAAIKYAFDHPKDFGIDPERIDYWPPLAIDTATIKVRYQLNLKTVAEWTGSTRREIRRLNPEVRTAWPQGTYVIKLPLGTREVFLKQLEAVHRKK